jgi:hypothetical protein
MRITTTHKSHKHTHVDTNIHAHEGRQELAYSGTCMQTNTCDLVNKHEYKMKHKHTDMHQNMNIQKHRSVNTLSNHRCVYVITPGNTHSIITRVRELLHIYKHNFNVQCINTTTYEIKCI